MKSRPPDYARNPVALGGVRIPRQRDWRDVPLLPHQAVILRAAFAFDAAGRLPYDTIVYAAPKKSGKTAMNAALTLWWAFTQEAPNELLVVANDLEQAQGRVFRTACGMLERNPSLRSSAEISNKGIRLSNGSLITPISSEYAGAAGSNHGLVSFDELWGFTLESARRLWDELTPVPTRRNSIRLVTTYAGWEGESQLLHDLYRLGVSGDEHPEGKGIQRSCDAAHRAQPSGQVVHVLGPHAPHAVAEREILRVPTGDTDSRGPTRLHENRWTTSESTFITPALWDGCVEAHRRPLPPRSRHTSLRGRGREHEARLLRRRRRHLGRGSTRARVPQDLASVAGAPVGSGGDH